MTPPTRLQRFLIPGLAFKAVIIAGGYATGRELAEFFGPAGPVGGIVGMLLAMGIWSVVAALVFLYARRAGTHDYQSFMRHLLGPAWPLFELLLVLLLLVSLAVFSAAAGAIGNALFGLPDVAGQLALIAATILVVCAGSAAVERLFAGASVLLYATYAAFLGLAFWAFGDRIVEGLGAPVAGTAWLTGGLSYSGYNAVGLVLVLYVVRHFTSPRDAAIAGLLAGPLAMLPAILFFIVLAAFPAALEAKLPSDYLLRQLGVPGFAFVYQGMIFLALLESSVGVVHGLNERIANVRGPERFGALARALSGAAILLLAGFAAQRIGLVDLIAKGYRYMSYAMIVTFLLPLLTLGSWRLWRWHVGSRHTFVPKGQA